MKKHLAAVRLIDRDEATEAVELPEELRLPLGAIAGVAREGLLTMCTTVGLAVMGEMMTAEMTAKVGGPRHAKLAQRQGNWHGSAPGSVVLGGRRVPVERPRGRTVAGGELELAAYAAFSSDDLLSQVVMERMLAGVATRRYARVNEPVGDDLDAQATSTLRSSVSRRFKAATDAQLDELMSRDLSELDLAALMLDGVHFATPVVSWRWRSAPTGQGAGRPVVGRHREQDRRHRPTRRSRRPGASIPTAGCWS